MKRLLALSLVALPLAGVATLTACPPPRPVPTQPDADAAPAPVPTTTHAPVSAACRAACNNMVTLHCSGLTDRCGQIMADLEHDRMMRSPDGGSLSCACVAGAPTPAAIAACGVGCWTGDAAP